MGLFGSTRTYVASSVWNLAGEPDAQLRVVPSIVLSAVLAGDLSGRGPSTAERMQSALLNSAAMQQRRFLTWASQNYAIAPPTGTIGSSRSVNGAGIFNALRTDLLARGILVEGQQLVMDSAVVDDAEVYYWSEIWIRNNRPDLTRDDWTSDYDTAGGQIVTIYPSDTDPNMLLTHVAGAPSDLLWLMGDPSRLALYVTYRIGTKVDGFFEFGPDRLYTYRIGAGTPNAVPAFDALQTKGGNLAEFYPPIPLRLHNTMIDAAEYADIFPSVKEACKRLAGVKIEDILATLAENESLDDMDHVMIVSGVPLNTRTKAGRRYIYEFLRALAPLQLDGQTPASLQSRADARLREGTEISRWLAVNTRGAYPSGDQVAAFHKLFGGTLTATVPNAAPLLTLPSRNTLRLSCEDLPEYDVELSWFGIYEQIHVGLARSHVFAGGLPTGTVRPPVPVGDVWIVPLKDIPIGEREGGRSYDGSFRNVSATALVHRTGTYAYRVLTVLGLEHLNRIYKGKTVQITARDALADTEESGFLVPLHGPTLRSMGLGFSAELSRTSTYLMINSYQVVKQKWYQTGFFKIILVVASIALSVVTAGGSLAVTPGLLGTNIAVGTALGAVGTTAIILGAVANAVAGLILTTIITKASTEFFGDKVGSIIGTIVSFVAMQATAQYFATGSASVNWAEVFSPQNLIEMSNSVSKAYAAWVQNDTAAILNQIPEIQERYATELAEIDDLSREILGMTNLSIDATLLTDADEHFGESSDVFLGRTLMTGSDIAALSQSLIDDFVAISLELPRAQ